MSQDVMDALPAQGWSEGVDKALALLEDTGIGAGATHMARRWSHDDGERFDVERHYAGLAPWQAYHRTAGGTNGRIVPIVAVMGTPGGVTAQTIAWRVYAAVKAIDMLEDAGYRVELTAAYLTLDMFTLRRDAWELWVRVKEADDPVDLSQIAAVLSAAAHRWYGWAWKAAEPDTISDGFGRVPIHAKPTDVEPGTIILGRDVDSRETAQAWLDSLETARLGEVGHDNS